MIQVSAPDGEVFFPEMLPGSEGTAESGSQEWCGEAQVDLFLSRELHGVDEGARGGIESHLYC